MSERLKDNGCHIFFECHDPKKCAHYKKLKIGQKPCVYNGMTTDRCFYTIAQMQAIVKHCKSIGVVCRFSGGRVNDTDVGLWLHTTSIDTFKY